MKSDWKLGAPGDIISLWQNCGSETRVFFYPSARSKSPLEWQQRVEPILNITIDYPASIVTSFTSTHPLAHGSMFYCIIGCSALHTVVHVPWSPGGSSCELQLRGAVQA